MRSIDAASEAKLPSRYLLILVAATLTACAPIPNERYYAPKIVGKITRGNVPVPNAEVILSAEFFEKTSNAKTDISGNFKVRALKEFRLIAYLFGDPLYAYRLTIKVDGNEYEGYAESGMGDSLKPIYLECDLERPHKWRNGMIFCEPGSSTDTPHQ